MRDLRYLTYEEFEKEASEKDKKIFKKALENFPEIKDDKIGIKTTLVIKLKYAAIAMIDDLHFSKYKEIKLRPTIYLGTVFKGLNDEIKETIFAHELGHYLRGRKNSIEQIKKHIRWSQETFIYSNSRDLTDKEKRRYIRLKKWPLLNDKYADEQALKRGYGESLLHFLKWINIVEDMRRINKDHIALRIKNLEEKLKDGKE